MLCASRISLVLLCFLPACTSTTEPQSTIGTADVGDPPTLIVTDGGTDQARLRDRATDDVYWFYTRLQFRHRSTDGADGDSFLTYAIDTSGDEGATYVERYRIEISLPTWGQTAFVTQPLNPISHITAPGRVDRIRIRLVSRRADPNVELDLAATGVRGRTFTTDGAHTFTFTVAP